MPENLIIQIVASESTPEKEEEYNKWYTDVHVPMLFEYKGLKKAARYRLIDENKECARFLAIYEFESDEAQAAFPSSPEFAAAIEDFENMKEKTDFQMRWAASYQLIKSWER